MLDSNVLIKWIKDVTGWEVVDVVDREFHHYGTTVVGATYKIENLETEDYEIIKLTPNKEDKIVTAVREMPGGLTPDWNDETVVKKFPLKWNSPFNIL